MLHFTFSSVRNTSQSLTVIFIKLNTNLNTFMGGFPIYYCVNTILLYYKLLSFNKKKNPPLGICYFRCSNFHHFLPFSHPTFSFSLQYRCPMWKERKVFLLLLLYLNCLQSSFHHLCNAFNSCISIYIFLTFLLIYIEKAFGLSFICHRHIKILLLVDFILSLYILTSRL